MAIAVSRVQVLFLVAYAAAVAAYYLQPPVAGWISVMFLACAGTAVAGMIFGVILYPARRKPAWLLLLTGMIFEFLGAGTGLAYLKITGSWPFPSASDALELTANLFLVAGLVMLSRGGGLHLTRRGVMTAAVVTGVAAGLFSWPVLIRPYASNSQISLFDKLVAMAYPSCDVLLLFQVFVLASVVLAMRHFRKEARISVSFWFIVAGVFGVLVSDSVFSYAVLHWNWSQPSAADAGWFVWFGAWALAFLSSKRELSPKAWYFHGVG